MVRGLALTTGALGTLFLLVTSIAGELETEIAGIARFKDGDSGFVGHTEIRLRCIDAPEYDKAEGIMAARLAWREIDGQRLVCIRRQRSLSYGRIVVSCIFDSGPYKGRNVNRHLVQRGPAVYVSCSCAREASRW